MTEAVLEPLDWAPETRKRAPSATSSRMRDRQSWTWFLETQGERIESTMPLGRIDRWLRSHVDRDDTQVVFYAGRADRLPEFSTEAASWAAWLSTQSVLDQSDVRIHWIPAAGIAPEDDLILYEPVLLPELATASAGANENVSIMRFGGLAGFAVVFGSIPALLLSVAAGLVGMFMGAAGFALANYAAYRTGQAGWILGPAMASKVFLACVGLAATAATAGLTT